MSSHAFRVHTLMPVQLPLNISPNMVASFDNFFVSTENHLLVEHLQGFINNPVEWLIYLWGETGGGVSHLLSATMRHLSSYDCCYLPLKELVFYSPKEFFSDLDYGLEHANLVCIDDVDILSSQDQQWQQQLFHLINRLRDANKKLVVGAHCAPRQLSINLADLKSRLQWGSVYKIQALNDEESQHLLQERALLYGFQMSTEVAAFILQRTSRSVPSLLNILERLHQASLAAKRRLTIPFVKQVLNI